VLVPSTILPEVDSFLRNDRAVMRKLISEIFDPATTYRYEPVSPIDFVRAMQLDAKFADLRLGLVDCSVAALAERTGIYRVLTSDHRDFAALRVGARLDRALRLVP
jgi:predicted nucleic acid-binding protein